MEALDGTKLDAVAREPQRGEGGWWEWRVPNVSAAVALARRLQRDRGYKYFRGQRDASWQMTSSFGRLAAAEQSAEIRKFEAFYAWVKSSPELLPYLQDDTAILAAAQHHGVSATTLIDLTTDPEVAGWFATDGGVQGDEGVILLVDPEPLESLFAGLSARGLILRFLVPDVANLWRLQSQRGLFLEAQTTVDAVWPMDRIVFPQDGSGPAIDRRRIYPERKSHLEQMIDQHWLLKAREEAWAELLASVPASAQLHLEAPTLPEELDAMQQVVVPVQLRPPEERWDAMDFREPAHELALEAFVSSGLELEALVKARRGCVDFVVVTSDLPLRNGSFQVRLNELWTGMRPLAYSDAQIACALTALARLHPVLGDFPLDEGHPPDLVAGHLMADPVHLELGIRGGGSTRACVSAAGLWSALKESSREDLGLLEPPSAGVLMNALDPFYGRTLHLFDPVCLMDLFARELVPWQVAVKRRPTVFWPEHISVLGRP